jgi:hypothetical protein
MQCKLDLQVMNASTFALTPVSQTSMTGTIPPGDGGNLQFYITVAGQSSNNIMVSALQLYRMEFKFNITLSSCSLTFVIHRHRPS